uniref:RING-type domain-containing protein n=1 Tax=Parastrongyloides trichosuri TaxID=131310 RepID=A0A0N4ZDG0_PARTI
MADASNGSCSQNSSNNSSEFNSDNEEDLSIADIDSNSPTNESELGNNDFISFEYEAIFDNSPPNPTNRSTENESSHMSLSNIEPRRVGNYQILLQHENDNELEINDVDFITLGYETIRRNAIIRVNALTVPHEVNYQRLLRQRESGEVRNIIMEALHMFHQSNLIFSRIVRHSAIRYVRMMQLFIRRFIVINRVTQEIVPRNANQDSAIDDIILRELSMYEDELLHNLINFYIDRFRFIRFTLLSIEILTNYYTEGNINMENRNGTVNSTNVNENIQQQSQNDSVLQYNIRNDNSQREQIHSNEIRRQHVAVLNINTGEIRHDLIPARLVYDNPMIWSFNDQLLYISTPFNLQQGRNEMESINDNRQNLGTNNNFQEEGNLHSTNGNAIEREYSIINGIIENILNSLSFHNHNINLRELFNRSNTVVDLNPIEIDLTELINSSASNHSLNTVTDLENILRNFVRNVDIENQNRRNPSLSPIIHYTSHNDQQTRSTLNDNSSENYNGNHLNENTNVSPENDYMRDQGILRQNIFQSYEYMDQGNGSHVSQIISQNGASPSDNNNSIRRKVIRRSTQRVNNRRQESNQSYDNSSQRHDNDQHLNPMNLLPSMTNSDEDNSDNSLNNIQITLNEALRQDIVNDGYGDTQSVIHQNSTNSEHNRESVDLNDSINQINNETHSHRNDAFLINNVEDSIIPIYTGSTPQYTVSVIPNQHENERIIDQNNLVPINFSEIQPILNSSQNNLNDIEEYQQMPTMNEPQQIGNEEQSIHNVIQSTRNINNSNSSYQTFTNYSALNNDSSSEFSLGESLNNDSNLSQNNTNETVAVFDSETENDTDSNNSNENSQQQVTNNRRNSSSNVLQNNSTRRRNVVRMHGSRSPLFIQGRYRPSNITNNRPHFRRIRPAARNLRRNNESTSTTEDVCDVSNLRRARRSNEHRENNQRRSFYNNDFDDFETHANNALPGGSTRSAIVRTTRAPVIQNPFEHLTINQSNNHSEDHSSSQDNRNSGLPIDYIPLTSYFTPQRHYFDIERNNNRINQDGTPFRMPVLQRQSRPTPPQNNSRPINAFISRFRNSLIRGRGEVSESMDNFRDNNSLYSLDILALHNRRALHEEFLARHAEYLSSTSEDDVLRFTSNYEDETGSSISLQIDENLNNIAFGVTPTGIPSNYNETLNDSEENNSLNELNEVSNENTALSLIDMSAYDRLYEVVENERISGQQSSETIGESLSSITQNNEQLVGNTIPIDTVENVITDNDFRSIDGTTQDPLNIVRNGRTLSFSEFSDMSRAERVALRQIERLSVDDSSSWLVNHIINGRIYLANISSLFIFNSVPSQISRTFFEIIIERYSDSSNLHQITLNEEAYFSILSEVFQRIPLAIENLREFQTNDPSIGTRRVNTIAERLYRLIDIGGSLTAVSNTSLAEEFMGLMHHVDRTYDPPDENAMRLYYQFLNLLGDECEHYLPINLFGLLDPGILGNSTRYFRNNTFINNPYIDVRTEEGIPYFLHLNRNQLFIMMYNTNYQESIRIYNEYINENGEENQSTSRIRILNINFEAISVQQLSLFRNRRNEDMEYVPNVLQNRYLIDRINRLFNLETNNGIYPVIAIDVNHNGSSLRLGTPMLTFRNSEEVTLTERNVLDNDLLNNESDNSDDTRTNDKNTSSKIDEIDDDTLGESKNEEKFDNNESRKRRASSSSSEPNPKQERVSGSNYNSDDTDNTNDSFEERQDEIECIYLSSNFDESNIYESENSNSESSNGSIDNNVISQSSRLIIIDDDARLLTVNLPHLNSSNIEQEESKNDN